MKDKPIKMFEIRWAERETGKQLMNDWGYFYPETTKVLEFRSEEHTSELQSH